MIVGGASNEGLRDTVRVCRQRYRRRPRWEWHRGSSFVRESLGICIPPPSETPDSVLRDPCDVTFDSKADQVGCSKEQLEVAVGGFWIRGLKTLWVARVLRGPSLSVQAVCHDGPWRRTCDAQPRANVASVVARFLFQPLVTTAAAFAPATLGREPKWLQS